MDDYCKYIYYGAAKSGNLALFQHMRSQGYPFNRKACEIAATNGHLDIIQYIMQEIQIWNISEAATYDEWIEQVICAAAAKNGRLHILKAMPAKTDMNFALHEALSNGQLEILTWLKHNNYVTVEDALLSISAENLDSLTWLTTEYNNFEWKWDESVMYIAAKAGNINTIQLLRDKNCTWNSSACTAAAENGHFDILQFLHENGCPWNSTTMCGAVEYGDLKVVQWLMNNRCPINPLFTMNSAVVGGNLELIKMLHSTINVSLKPNLCTMAIKNKRWEVFRWLLDNQCVPNSDTMLAALDAKLSLEILIEIYAFTTEANVVIIERAAKNGRKDFIDWLFKTNERSKAPKYFYLMWNCVVEGAINGNHPDILKNALINCFNCTESLPLGMRETPELYRWLHKQGCISNAVKNLI